MRFAKQTLQIATISNIFSRLSLKFYNPTFFLPLEGGGPNATNLDRPAQASQQAKGRTKLLAFGVGVKDLTRGAKTHPHPAR
jgi:hypothetical protein